MTKAPTTRYIGIDFGLARIGLSISDERHIIARSISTFPAEKKMKSTVIKLLKFLHDHQHEHCYQINKIVVGMPYLMNGSEGLLVDAVKQFISLLQEQSSYTIVTWDERLTSVQAERSLRESNMSRKKRSKVVDQVSAILILQNYLDAQPR